jgi:hypothetical protein
MSIPGGMIGFHEIKEFQLKEYFAEHDEKDLHSTLSHEVWYE